MTSIRFFPNAEELILELPGVVPFLLDTARGVESRIRVPRRASQIRTFAHASKGLTVDRPYSQAGMRGPGAGAIEFGTTRTPAQAPVRRAVRSGR